MSNRLLSLFDHLVWLSTLLTERYDHVTQTFDVVVSQEYVALTKCQPCHSRLVPLRAKPLSCVSTLHSVCMCAKLVNMFNRSLNKSTSFSTPSFLAA